VLEMRLANGAKDSTAHKFLTFPLWQDAWRKFAASWMSRFGNSAQQQALDLYEEKLRRLSIKWSHRWSAAAEVDFHYRRVLAEALRSSGSLALSADNSRSLPTWRIDDDIARDVLGFPNQELLPFCSLCNAHHACNSCPYDRTQFHQQPQVTDLLGSTGVPGNRGNPGPGNRGNPGPGNNRGNPNGNPKPPGDRPKPTCFGHNRGNCKRGRNCKFQHVCAVCGDASHVATACSQPGGGPTWTQPH